MAQKISIKPEKYDFGKIEAWDNPSAAFLLLNETNHALRFLPNFFEKDCSIDMPKAKIPPGHTASFFIYYFPKQTGKFTKKINIYLAEEKEPLEIVITGYIESFAHNALTECPGPSFRKEEKAGFDQQFFALDKTTGIPIEGVDIYLSDGEMQLIEIKSNKEGKAMAKLVPNRFIIAASHPTYYPVDDVEFLNRQSGKYLIKMSPMPLATPVIAAIEDLESDKDSLPLPKDDKEEDAASEEPVLSVKKYKPNHLVMLIDNSKSMEENEKMAQLKQAAKTMIEAMRDIDRISIISYAYHIEVLAENTSLDYPQPLLESIYALTPKGKTYGAAAITKAYEIALQYYEEGYNNQIILCTDGLFNESEISDRELMKMIRSGLQKGIKLSVVGFGRDIQAASRMNDMAKNGGGNVILFEDGHETEKLLLTEVKMQSKY